MQILRVTPEGPSFRTIAVEPIPLGRSEFTSINCPPACFGLHFRSRSIPCLGPGCPLCPLPARLTAILPGKWSDKTTINALQLPCHGQVIELVKEWQQGWKLTLTRASKRTRVVEVKQSLHIDVGPVTEADLDESLARMWGLPSPATYPNEAAWISACFAVIGRRL
jgi:hypothetical protein